MTTFVIYSLLGVIKLLVQYTYVYLLLVLFSNACLHPILFWITGFHILYTQCQISVSGLIASIQCKGLTCTGTLIFYRFVIVGDCNSFSNVNFILSFGCAFYDETFAIRYFEHIVVFLQHRRKYQNQYFTGETIIGIQWKHKKRCNSCLMQCFKLKSWYDTHQPPKMIKQYLLYDDLVLSRDKSLIFVFFKVKKIQKNTFSNNFFRVFICSTETLI